MGFNSGFKGLSDRVMSEKFCDDWTM